MTFAHPSWLWLLWLAPLLLLGKVWADWRADQTVDLFVAKRLRGGLLLGGSKWRAWLIHALQLLALACFILTLCRPRWGEEKRELRESGRNILIAIDTSRSMLATDVAPDRLTRAKLAAQDLLASLAGDRVGLIAFAGQAYLQAPLTTDHDAVNEAIQSLDTTSVPQGGSDITKALRVAIEAVEKSPARNHGMIVFSDGGDQVPAIPYYVNQAQEKHILVMSVGVGTEAGSLIPNPDPARAGDFIRDPKGNVVQSKLESSILQQVASGTGGRYLKLGSAPITRALVDDILVALERQQETSREERKPIERFRWPLSLGIFFLMTAWLIRPSSSARRFSAAAIAVVSCCMAPHGAVAAGADGGGTGAPFFGSIFQRKDVGDANEAKEAYARGIFERARDVYARLLSDKPPASDAAEIAYGLGASAHQLKDYDRAVDAFSDALEASDESVQNRAHRGIAHSLYDQGDRALAKQPQFTIRAWTDSIRHFDAALALHDDADARENRDFVKKRLEELKQQEEQKKQQQKKQGGKKDGQQGQGKEGDESEEEGEKGQKGKEGKEGKDKQQQQQGKEGEEEGKQSKGGKGEEEQGKEGRGKEQLPEGQIAAGQGGEKPDKEEEQKEQREMAESERNEMTGFSRNEARAFLRTYADDQKTAVLRQQRREPANGRDW
ncbi:MAG: VWA domain-containing protein [Verrucomicrobiaceae bacterium]|nr:VWA domain-containing protein [Verrucomicrobiaceae bacterium]